MLDKTIKNVSTINLYWNYKYKDNENLKDAYYLFENADCLFKVYEKASQLNYNRNQIKTKNDKQYLKTKKMLEKSLNIILKELYIGD